MDKLSIQKEARTYFVPFLLGNNSVSHKLSKKIYRKYKITCFILDNKKHASDILDFSSRTLTLPYVKNNSITIEQLIYLAKQTPYTLPLLIPCNQKYGKLIETNREILESTFVLVNKDSIFTDSPLNVIPE